MATAADPPLYSPPATSSSCSLQNTEAINQMITRELTVFIELYFNISTIITNCLIKDLLGC